MRVRWAAARSVIAPYRWMRALGSGALGDRAGGRATWEGRAPSRPLLLPPSIIPVGAIPRLRHSATHSARFAVSTRSSRNAPSWARYVTVNTSSPSPASCCCTLAVFHIKTESPPAHADGPSSVALSSKLQLTPSCGEAQDQPCR